jgi:hypothetical protein
LEGFALGKKRDFSAVGCGSDIEEVGSGHFVFAVTPDIRWRNVANF